VKDASKIQQFRPICLLNCIYKWFIKVLTLRLDLVAGRLVHKSHIAFLHGRNIMNSVLALHEILHEIKRKKQVGVVLKLDFEKAHDKVHWGFLLRCLKARGFNETWCSCISQILNNGNVAVKLNIMVGPYFQSYKGVRQGDPLSPYSLIWWLTV
jgi:hypothetical protein